MDWIKIKTQHVLFSGLTPSEKGMLVMIQALTAHLERLPSEKEIVALPGLSRSAVGRLSESLRNINAELSEVLRKVIEDVSEVHRKRDAEKDRKRSLRSKNANVPRDKGGTSRGPHGRPFREEKIREDKSIVDKSTTPPTSPTGDGVDVGDFEKRFFEDSEIPEYRDIPSAIGFFSKNKDRADRLAAVMADEDSRKRKNSGYPIQDLSAYSRSISKKLQGSVKFGVAMPNGQVFAESDYLDLLIRGQSKDAEKAEVKEIQTLDYTVEIDEKAVAKAEAIYGPSRGSVT